MPLPNINLTMNQSVTVTAVPEDANGNPGDITGNLTWSQPSGIQVNQSGSGLSAVITAGTTPGVYQVNVSGTSSTGGTITSSFDVTVAEAPATQIAFTFGTPS